MLKTIFIKVVLLFLILVGLNLVYTFTFYKKDLADKSKEIIEIQHVQKNTDVYYFGESSNITYSSNDSTKSSISELTNLFFPSIKISAITKYGAHGGIYRHWLNEIDLAEKRPKAIVITLNLRSFDAAWIHSKLETQLQESLVFTRPYPNMVNRFLLSLQAFDNRTEQQREQEMKKEWQTKKLVFQKPFKYATTAEWDFAMAQGGCLKADGSWHMEKIVLACHNIKSYAFNLDDENPRIKDFDQIADWCSTNKINLYLNLMAENVEYADSLVGKELVFLMKENRDFLVKRYSRAGCMVVDNLELVKGKNFIDQNWTTEHYDGKGRMRIAKNLADNLKNQFKNEYKPAY